MVVLRAISYASCMVDAIDPARLESLPADLRAAFEAQANMLAELDQERSARLRIEAENALLKEANARLELLVQELRRARFGPRSEKLDPEQQQLAFEDI